MTLWKKKIEVKKNHFNEVCSRKEAVQQNITNILRKIILMKFVQERKPENFF